MNFLAHGFRHCDDPWRCAGTALPDWARILGRRSRVHAERAAGFVAGADAAAAGGATGHVTHGATHTGDPRRAALAAGVLRHHDDDRVFHQSEAFADALRAATDVLRPVRAQVPGFRARFAAHVVIEMLLDAWLVDAEPARVDRYYGALASLPIGEIEAVAAPLVESPDGGGADGLGALVAGFVRSRFVAEYGDDARVAARFDQVARRVGLPPCEDALRPHVAALRAVVAPRAASLIAPALR